MISCACDPLFSLLFLLLLIPRSLSISPSLPNITIPFALNFFIYRSPDDTNLFFVHDLSYPLAQSLSYEKRLQRQELQAANGNSNNNSTEPVNSTEQNSEAQQALPVVKDQTV
jgi:hypothetical protein